NGPVDHVGTCLWQPSEGNLSVDMNANLPGGLSQPITTQSGKTYQVHFALAGNMLGGPPVKTMDVSFGTLFSNVQFDVTGKTASNPGWVCPTLRGTAPDIST